MSILPSLDVPAPAGGIHLTDDYMRRKAAAAVPGAYFDGKAWTLPNPTPRAAVVALKLFPELMHTHPELVEMRDSIIQDAKPVDYAAQCGIRIVASRVRSAMAARGWSLAAAKATPVDAGADYQEIDLGYIAAVLRQHGGAYLGWARGLGKTLGTAALIDELNCQHTLVIAPNSAKAVTWADELAWACPWLTVLTLPNDAKKREACLERAQRMYAGAEPFVLVVHFEALAIIAGKPTKKGSKATGDGWRKLGIKWDLKAADEGHRFANPDSLQSRAAVKVPARMRLVMSGSVFQNRWEELFGPLKFLYPDRYRSQWRDWNNRYFDYVENGYGRICVGIREDRIDAMRDELGRFMVVRDKKNLAEPTEVWVDMTADQQKSYDELADSLLTELPDGQRVKAGVGIALLTRLRQVACGLDLFNEGDLRDSCKLDATVATILDHWLRGDDFVVFGWYKASLRALEARLQELGIECFRIDGDVPQKQRTEMIRAFQNGQRRVLIGSIPTMGESVNLQRANHVIRMDRSFNPALNQQAVDRVDRQGQERKCYLTDIITRNTVDDMVVLPSLVNKDALRAVVFGARS